MGSEAGSFCADHGAGGITKGQAVTYTLSDGKKNSESDGRSYGNRVSCESGEFSASIACLHEGDDNTNRDGNLDSGRFTFSPGLRLCRATAQV
jgi:hypothetical protein